MRCWSSTSAMAATIIWVAIDWKPGLRHQDHVRDAGQSLQVRHVLQAESERIHGAGSGWNAGISGQLDSLTPYGIAACNTGSMGSAYIPASGGNPAVYTILSPANTPGGLPIINPACSVVTSYSAARADAHMDADRDRADPECAHRESHHEWRMCIYPRGRRP